MSQKTVFIWGFPGIGKSHCKLPLNAVDADSKQFQFLFPEDVNQDKLHQAGEWEGVLPNPDYPENYFSYVTSLDADVVFLNCHISLLDRIDKEKLLLVFPSESLKDEYLHRYASRGDTDSFIEYMDNIFEEMISYIRQSPFRKYEITQPTVFLDNLINGGTLMSQFITKKELTDLIEESRQLGVYDHWDPNVPSTELAQRCFEGAFDLDIAQLQSALAERKKEIEQEQLINQRRGGLTHDELKGKILEGIVNGALYIHHGEIAPYSHGFEVKFRNEANETLHRWECYCSFPEVADCVVSKIEDGKMNKQVFSSNATLKPVDIQVLLSAIEKKEQKKVSSFVEEDKAGMLPRGRYTGDVASLSDVHTGRGLDGIILGRHQGDYSSITTGSQNDMIRTLVAMKGFCLDAIHRIPSRPLIDFALQYLKDHGTDVTSKEKLQAWIAANPQKCALPENRLRKPSLDGKINAASTRKQSVAPTIKENKQNKER